MNEFVNYTLTGQIQQNPSNTVANTGQSASLRLGLIAVHKVTLNKTCHYLHGPADSFTAGKS